MTDSNQGQPASFIGRAAHHVLVDISSRVKYVASHTWLSVFAALNLLPRVAADEAFVPHASNDSTINQDAEYLNTLFDFYSWQSEAMVIRAQPNNALCYGNLSLLLSSIGPLRQTELSGTAGALSLLPTAGALIGTPAKELWFLYKLVPFAGVLSMMLSLGGNIVPSETRDYTIDSKAFSYGGLIGTAEPEGRINTTDKRTSFVAPETTSLDAKGFAKRVKARAEKRVVRRRRAAVSMGIGMQIFWLAVLIATCWFVETGGIVIWWCKAWGWMHFWYLMVVVSSFLDNYAGVPFTEEWTIRAIRAPKVLISDNAPEVVSCPDTEHGPVEESPGQTGLSKGRPYSQHKAQTLTVSREVVEIEMMPFKTNDNASTNGRRWPSSPTENENILGRLKKGFDTVGSIAFPNGVPKEEGRAPFYVIISLGSRFHKRQAIWRAVSKAFSVGVYAAGTAIFASSTLITICVALAALSLILSAGIFGRVIAMWMSYELMSGDPVLHKVVDNHQEAADYVCEVLAQPGVLFEVEGHLILNGRCIRRYHRLTRLSTYFGLLAPPFNLKSLEA